MDKPVLHALVGYFFPPLGLVKEPLLMPLAEAVEYQRLGFWVFVDPADERALAHWEMKERSMNPPRKRFWESD